MATYAGAMSPHGRPSSLLWRILMFGVLPSLTLISVVMGVNGIRSIHALRQASEQLAVSEARMLAETVNGWNRKAVNVVRTMADAAEHGLFGRRAQSLAFLREVLQDHPEYEGLCFGYEPDADGQDAMSVAAARQGDPGAVAAHLMTEAGRFVPYLYRDRDGGGVIRSKPLSGFETDEFYQRPRESHRAGRPEPVILTEPYDYEGVPMTSAIATLEIEGRFAGIAGLDLSLERQRDRLREIARSSRLNVMLLSRGGRFIAAAAGDPHDHGELSDALDALAMQPMARTPWRGALDPVLSGNQPVGTGIVRNPVSGEHTVHAMARIPVGDWQVVVEVPPSRLAIEIWRQVRTSVIVGGLGLIAMSVLLVRMVVRLSRRIRMAGQAARDVADGDLTRVYAVDGGDEAGLLLSSMNDMSGRLNELVGRVRGVTLEITGTATQMASASRQQEEVAQGFGASSAEIAAAVRQISVTGGELLRSMESLSVAAVESAQLAGEGREGLQAMGQTMQELASATAGVAERLAAINEKAVNINAIVDTITKVADQTNLLSVNAAIEAEKAGESGRGFLVVAREIRRLADQTAAATLDIETTVRQMQGAVSGGVMEMDRFSDQVRRGVEHVAGVGERLTKVIDRVGSVEGRFGQVTEGMQSQVQGAEQIRQSMDTLAQAAGRAREATSEFAQAASTLQSSLAQLRAAVGLFRLRDQA
jgi:methyl-accepting chemotaxis protein